MAAERRATLATQARPVMDYVFSQIKDSGCVMLLSDENGYVLDSAGDIDFCTRAAQVALSPGASWAEEARGTNAIGTALIERKPMVVNGTEHYLRHNNFLACAAAPLTEPDGKLLGVIDISCDARRYHPHTFGLVRAAAQMIEKRIFELAFLHQTKLRFHMSSNCLGSLMEGEVAIAEDGRILGASRAGFAMLGLRHEDIGTREICSVFDLTMAELTTLGVRAQGEAVGVRLRNGELLYLTVEQMRAPVIRRPAMPAAEVPHGPMHWPNWTRAMPAWPRRSASCAACSGARCPSCCKAKPERARISSPAPSTPPGRARTGPSWR